MGREITGRARLVFGTGATITGDGDWFVPLPVAASEAAVLGNAWMATGGGMNYLGLYQSLGANTNAVVRPHGSLFTANRIRPFTWTAGDSLYLQYTYEAAS